MSGPAVSPPRTRVESVAVVGAGAIGCSWAALAAYHGVKVLVSDPAPDAQERLLGTVRDQLRELAPDTAEPAARRVEFTPHLAEAVAGADFVVEAAPERLEVKRELYAAIDAAAAPDVVLASSSSGFGPTAFQDVCRHPERVVVAHPFNPPHLVPLVEIVGGQATSEETIAAATQVMLEWGRRPIRVHAELPGHAVNRLQAALWREAYDLVRRGALSVADLDAAVACGPGLRWALVGPIGTQHLSGGPGGLAHVLEHLGPPMVDWWADLGTPTLTPNLVATLVDGVAEEFDGSEQSVLAARDRGIRELLAAKERLGLDRLGRPADESGGGEQS